MYKYNQAEYNQHSAKYQYKGIPVDNSVNAGKTISMLTECSLDT